MEKKRKSADESLKRPAGTGHRRRKAGESVREFAARSPVRRRGKGAQLRERRRVEQRQGMRGKKDVE